MNDDQVYADWSSVRYIVPTILGLVLAAVAAGVVVVVASGGDGDGDDLVGESVPSTAAIAADPRAQAEQVLSEFLVRLEQDRLDSLQYAFTDGATAAEDYRQLVARIGSFTVDVRSGPVTIHDTANASAPTTTTWTLDDGTVFTTEGEADLVLLGTSWLVDWEPAVLEISLDPGDVLVRERVVAPRAPILGRDGAALIDNRPVTAVGVIPRQAGEIGPLSEALGPLVGRDPSEVRELIAPSPSDSTVVVATLGDGELGSVEAALRAIPGVVFETSTFPLPPDPRFGRALLGRSAEVTAEILDEHPDLYQVGDIAGRSGLQREYNARLTGRPGFQIRVQRRFPGTGRSATASTTTTSAVDQAGLTSGVESVADDSTGSVAVIEDPAAPLDPDVVYRLDPVPGTPLHLTIDPRVQRAAEDALARTELTGALVAIEPSTGHILAVANGPGASVHNRAMTGQYPPGSIFKTITAYAAMTGGVGPGDPVDCPLAIEVNGRHFTNAEGEVLGTVPLRQAFVHSCNTAFINLGSVLDRSDFPSAAAAFGVGVGYDLGTAGYSGSVPTPDGPVDKAATSFGQGRILFSPLSAAVMSATAASGTYRPPRLVLGADDPVPDGTALDPVAATNIQQFMREVVTGGTGRAVAGVAGGPVSGKTGTAEFGDADPPEAHAWFVGFQNDLAFAVFVEGGEFGGATAAPIAADFLNRLAG